MAKQKGNLLVVFLCIAGVFTVLTLYHITSSEGTGSKSRKDDYVDSGAVLIPTSISDGMGSKSRKDDYVDSGVVLIPSRLLDENERTQGNMRRWLARVIGNNTHLLNPNTSLGKPCMPTSGLEDERSRFTLVTSLYDIGRGIWSNQNRGYEQYLGYLSFVLQYDVNIVVFIEPKGVNFVLHQRRNCLNRTKIVISSYGEQDMSIYERRLDEILKSSKWNKDNKLRTLAESHPNYIVTTNSKPGLTKLASELNPFHTTHFFWVDAGYGHGEKWVFTQNMAWAPRPLLANDKNGKVFLVQLSDPDTFRDKMDRFYKLSAEPAFAGGFFGGDVNAITKLSYAFKEMFVRALDEGFTDDDQGTHLLVHFNKPDLYYTPKGKWNDVFQRFK